MGFTTATFTFAFLPLVLAIYYLTFLFQKKNRNSQTYGNIVLSIFSLLFYSWAFAINGIVLLVYVLIVYWIGIWIETTRNKAIAIPVYVDNEREETRVKIGRLPLILGLVLAIVLLYHFKYASKVSSLLSSFFYIDANRYANIMVPLGISFITFSAISYFVDIYKNNASAGSFSDCLLYFVFFPKVVSGPIVLWEAFQKQINAREISTKKFVAGLNLVAIGFAKKIILADTFGLYADKITGIAIDTPTAWLGWILYALQIYYDFAGYSDIAIGVSRMFGFEFSPNFYFPYRATSITEFWRKWHISLGNFFKNYIYIPLGGNRKGFKRTLVNLMIVFLVTGVWHGVGAAYIIWGAIHGIFIVYERVIKDKKWYIKIPKLVKWAFTFFITACAWQFFRYGGDVRASFASLARLLGFHPSYTNAEIVFPWQFYLDQKIIVLIVVGFFGSNRTGQ